VSAAAASPAAGPAAGRSETLVFDVVFSLFTLIEANTDNPEAPIALGDEVVFHDQLFSNGQHAGGDVGPCVVVALAADFPNNCGAVIRPVPHQVTWPDSAEGSLPLTAEDHSARCHRGSVLVRLCDCARDVLPPASLLVTAPGITPPRKSRAARHRAYAFPGRSGRLPPHDRSTTEPLRVGDPGQR
jgi:hypothetical protein